MPLLPAVAETSSIVIILTKGLTLMITMKPLFVQGTKRSVISQSREGGDNPHPQRLLLLLLLLLLLVLLHPMV